LAIKYGVPGTNPGTKTKMRITVKLFATLREGKLSTNVCDVHDGSTAGDAIRELGVRDEEAALILVNGKHGDLGTVLSEGDTVAVFPPIGGG
jgi:molybdopterin converting factor small subunit